MEKEEQQEDTDTGIWKYSRNDQEKQGHWGWSWTETRNGKLFYITALYKGNNNCDCYIMTCDGKPIASIQRLPSYEAKRDFINNAIGEQ